MLKCERCTVFLLDLKIYEEVFDYYDNYNQAYDDDQHDDDDTKDNENDDDFIAAGRGGMASERLPFSTLPCQHHLKQVSQDQDIFDDHIFCFWNFGGDENVDI